MNYYKSNKTVILLIDLFSMILSFTIVFAIRFTELMKSIGNFELVSMYVAFFLVEGLLYILVFLIRTKPRLERESYKEIWYDVIEQQVIFMIVYLLLFFIFQKSNIISRIVVGLFFVGNVTIDGIGRLVYRNYCVKRTYHNSAVESRSFENVSSDVTQKSREYINEDIGELSPFIKHIYVCGSKNLGQYGGFESFMMNLLQQHADQKNIKYHVACKRNGDGCMDISMFPGAVRINENEFTYCNADCFFIDVNTRLGAGQAIDYDIKALRWCCEHIEKNHIQYPIVYILANRIGPFETGLVRRIHKAGGKVYQNPDGHEDWRQKWNLLIKRYWKFSEKIMVRNADLVICDSKNIESYIKAEYSQYYPETVWIPYGSVIPEKVLADDDPKYTNWLMNHELKDGQFYISVGRLVPENNFEIMIREFMASNTKKDFAIICTEEPKLMAELQQKLHFENDKRIKFVGTVYDQELLTKIRVNAYGYLHGHSVGGTNPSLLEALGTTKLNLLYNVGFNREVAEEGALYWFNDEGELASLINMADQMSLEQLNEMGKKAKQRVSEVYSWENVGQQYFNVFCRQ